VDEDIKKYFLPVDTCMCSSAAVNVILCKSMLIIGGWPKHAQHTLTEKEMLERY
jgi:hypothetical protein